MKYVAWMKAPGSVGLGNSVAIGERADVERVAREIEATPRWRLHHPQTEVTITRGERQAIVTTFLITAPAPATLHENDKLEYLGGRDPRDGGR